MQDGEKETLASARSLGVLHDEQYPDLYQPMVHLFHIFWRIEIDFKRRIDQVPRDPRLCRLGNSGFS